MVVNGASIITVFAIFLSIMALIIAMFLNNSRFSNMFFWLMSVLGILGVLDKVLAFIDK